jgi:hypothetical protein
MSVTSLRNNEETTNVGKKWYIEEDEKLVQEIHDNKSYEEIALEHKRTVTGIKSRVISNIIYPKYKENNMDIEKISLEYNIDIELLKKYINKLDTKKSVNITDNEKILEYLVKLDNKIDEINSKLDKLLNS